MRYDSFEQSVILTIDENLRKPSNFFIKEDKSIVTDIDKLISKKIKVLCKHFFDDFSFISEEEITKNNRALYTIVIDPIDGTENFANNIPIFGFSLAIYFNESHEYSLLYFPKLNLKLSSLDEKTISTKQKSRIVALSSSMTLQEIITESKNYEEYRITGCATYNIFSVITKSFKNYYNPRACSWDILAGINLAIQFNCKVLIDGEKYYGKYLQEDKRYSLSISN